MPSNVPRSSSAIFATAEGSSLSVCAKVTSTPIIGPPSIREATVDPSEAILIVGPSVNPVAAHWLTVFAQRRSGPCPPSRPKNRSMRRADPDRADGAVLGFRCHVHLEQFALSAAIVSVRRDLDRCVFIVVDAQVLHDELRALGRPTLGYRVTIALRLSHQVRQARRS